MAVYGQRDAAGYRMAPRVNIGRAGLVARAEDDKPNTVSSMAVPIAVCIA